MTKNGDLHSENMSLDVSVAVQRRTKLALKRAQLW